MAKLIITLTFDSEFMGSLPDSTAEIMAEVAKVLDAGDTEYHPAIVTNNKGEQIAVVESEIIESEEK